MQLAALLPLLTFIDSGLTNPVRRATGIEVRNFSASLYSNNTLGTLQFKVQSPSTNLNDSCFISWNPSCDIQPSIELNKCAHKYYEFGFRYGLQIENFVLDLKQVNESQTAYQVINSDAVKSNWTCLENPDQGIKERCHYNGVLNISL